MLWAELCSLPPKDVKILLVTQKATLLGNKVVAEVLVKTKSCWNRVGHFSRLTGQVSEGKPVIQRKSKSYAVIEI